MGIFDELKQVAVNAAAKVAAEHGPVAQKLFEMARTGNGIDVHVMVQGFADKGLGDIVNSWVGAGANLPVTAAQIQSVIGPEKLQTLAAQLGVPPDQISAKLAQYLPVVVDALTPNGKLPPPPPPSGPSVTSF